MPSHLELNYGSSNIPAHDLETILNNAISWGEKSILLDLIRLGFGTLQAALCASVLTENLELINFFLSVGANLNPTNNHSPLAMAVSINNANLVKRFLKMGADPCDPGALEQAINIQNTDMTITLLEAYSKRYQVRVISYDSLALKKAIEIGNNELLRTLSGYCDVNSMPQRHSYGSKQTSPLGEAILSDHPDSLELMRTILDSGGDPNSIVRINSRESG